MRLRALWEWLDRLRGIDRADDALYAADTAALERARRLASQIPHAIVPALDECPIPIPGCQTCGTSLPAWVSLPAVAADYSEHSWPAAFGVDAVAHWMIAVYPDAWYREQPTYIWAVAERLKAVRSRVLFGRVAL